jgi:hypothetical protein
MAQTPKRLRSELGITTLLPENRPPTHPGEMLLEEFLELRSPDAKKIALLEPIATPKNA